MKHRLSKTTRATAAVALLTALLFALLPALRGDDAKQAVAPVADGVFFRVRVAEPADQPWLAKIGGHIHVDPWSMAGAVLPAGADKDAAKKVAPGQFSEWFDLVGHAGAKIHGKHSRAGGIAEFPNITLQFSTPPDGKMAITVELATAPNEASVVKRLDEKFTGNLTSFLVSADLKKDAAELETASQMTARRLQWAREASGGKKKARSNSPSPSPTPNNPRPASPPSPPSLSRSDGTTS